MRTDDELTITLGGGSDLPLLNGKPGLLRVTITAVDERLAPQGYPRVVLAGRVRESEANVSGSNYVLDLENPPLEGGR